MHVEETFVVARPPDVVFDYVTNLAGLGRWQTANRSIERLTPLERTAGCGVG